MILSRYVANALGLAVATWLLSGITMGDGTLAEQAVIIAIIAVIFTVANGLAKPLLTVLSLPLVILTLGLFLFVINAAMLLLTSWVAGQFSVAWHVDGLLTALGGSIIVSLVSMVAYRIFGGDQKKKREKR